MFSDDFPPIEGEGIKRTGSLLKLKSSSNNYAPQSTDDFFDPDDFDLPPIFPDDNDGDSITDNLDSNPNNTTNVTSNGSAQPRVSLRVLNKGGDDTDKNDESIDFNKPDNELDLDQLDKNPIPQINRPSRLLLARNNQQVAGSTGLLSNILNSMSEPQLSQLSAQPTRMLGSIKNELASQSLHNDGSRQQSHNQVYTNRILQPKTPLEFFEYNVGNTIDRSIDNLKRSVIRDVSSAFRYNDSFDPSIIDSFSDSLIKDIEIIVNEQDYVPSEYENVPRKIISVYEDNLESIRRLFSEAESKNEQYRQNKIDDMQQIHSSLSELVRSVTSVATETLKELDRIRIDVTAQHDQQNMDRSQNERHLRSLKLRRSDLESKLNHQNMELESIERMLKQTESAIKEFEENEHNNTSTLAEKISKEVDGIFQEIDGAATTEFEDACEEVIRKLTEVSDLIREELGEVDYAEQFALNKLRNILASQANSFLSTSHSSYKIPISGQTKERSQILAATQEKIQEKRRLREKSRKFFESQMKSIQEGDYDTTYLR